MTTETIYPRTILHKEYTYQRRRVVLDACELSAGRYETMLMRPDGREITSATAHDEPTARADFAHIFAAHTPDAEKVPLTGKYAKLAADLRAAADAARAASAAHPDDGGTCNMDAAALTLPRWNAAKVEQAAKQACCTCCTWTLFGHKHFVFFPLDGCPGQGDRRSAAAEAMTRALAALGYDAIDYCQMD